MKNHWIGGRKEFSEDFPLHHFYRYCGEDDKNSKVVDKNNGLSFFKIGQKKYEYLVIEQEKKVSKTIKCIICGDSSSSSSSKFRKIIEVKKIRYFDTKKVLDLKDTESDSDVELKFKKKIIQEMIQEKHGHGKIFCAHCL